ncbi:MULTISPECIES: hypothetical protein [unclassified Burkholderia]|uniref:hypothetical protein n=1 Tax=unclassified Burkholderia TaxID=2613784 RepID=UPI00159F2F61|nr:MULTISPECIES: hypothetical protein [unclassified Burkholderia]MBR8235513.1 hypothetical protein [Burkholderia sp. AU32357]MBY4874561.1 hypothetical protein [Burkholderia sp. AU42008]
MRATIDAVWRRSVAGSGNDFILGGSGRRLLASLAVPRADYFELSVIIPRNPEIRVHMQNMHVNGVIRSGDASLPHCTRET